MYGLTSDGVSVAARSRVSETACRRNTRLPGSVPRLPGSVPCLGPVDEQAPSPSAGKPMHTRRPSAVRASDARSDPSQNPVEATGPGLVGRCRLWAEGQSATTVFATRHSEPVRDSRAVRSLPRASRAVRATQLRRPCLRRGDPWPMAVH